MKLLLLLLLLFQYLLRVASIAVAACIDGGNKPLIVFYLSCLVVSNEIMHYVVASAVDVLSLSISIVDRCLLLNGNSVDTVVLLLIHVFSFTCVYFLRLFSFTCVYF